MGEPAAASNRTDSALTSLPTPCVRQAALAQSAPELQLQGNELISEKALHALRCAVDKKGLRERR